MIWFSWVLWHINHWRSFDAMLYSYMHVHAEIYIYILDTYRHNDNRRRKTSLTKYLPLTLLQGFGKGYSRFACERELETEHNCNMAVYVVSFSFSWCSTGGPGVHSAGCWLSLLHLISIFSGPQFIRAPSPFSLVWLSLPQLLSNSNSNSTPWLLSWLSYMIVQRPLNHPLDLWNRMFNRHQAEITVMQFKGHSLPVRQSMRVSWDFLACPILLANFRPRDFLS